jgi:hypothetical protein
MIISNYLVYLFSELRKRGGFIKKLTYRDRLTYFYRVIEKLL